MGQWQKNLWISGGGVLFFNQRQIRTHRGYQRYSPDRRPMGIGYHLPWESVGTHCFEYGWWWGGIFCPQVQLHPQKGDYAGLTPQSVEYQKEVSAYNGVFVVTTTVKGGNELEDYVRPGGRYSLGGGTPGEIISCAPCTAPNQRPPCQWRHPLCGYGI